MPWLNGLAKAADDDQEDDVDVVLDADTGDDLIDAGVTSGSDASAWDPVHVEPNP